MVLPLHEKFPNIQAGVFVKIHNQPASLKLVPGKVPNPPAECIWKKKIVSYPFYREAARECRRKKKEYVKCLENRVAVLENQNKTLIEELKALKDLYCHKSE